jgi:arylsulfatase A-like enzyme
MKGDAWEAGHRVPFIVRYPGHVAPGSVSEQTISFTDLLATFAALLDVELPDETAADSFDLSPLLFSRQTESDFVRGPLIVSSSDGTHSIRVGPWKLIPGLGSRGFSEPRRVTPGPGDPAGQLYNLAEDPGETTNLYDQHPEIVERLQNELRESS